MPDFDENNLGKEFFDQAILTGPGENVIDAMNAAETNSDFTGTYSPDDNKLRLYAVYRLPKELYLQAKAAKFNWAPKQDLFYAYWSPAAEDFLIGLAGEIGDDDKSLVERSEIRADRFDEYSDKRGEEAQQAYDQVRAITDNIPMGQPILVGHHSEKKARKMAEKIERGMQKTVKLWDTSQYWTRRAVGALRSAKYKEQPAVRARRIKKLEAETRKFTRYVTAATNLVAFWASDRLTASNALAMANMHDHSSFNFTLEDYPRSPPLSQYEGLQGIWSAMTDMVISHLQARDLVLPLHRATIKYYTRYVEHNNNRLTYERAMLEAQGGTELLKPKPRPKQPPLLNYRQTEGFEIANRYHTHQMDHYPQYDMTKAELAVVHSDYKGSRHYNGHRVRICSNSFIPGITIKDSNSKRWGYSVVFLTDSKVHPRPDVVPVNFEKG